MELKGNRTNYVTTVTGKKVDRNNTRRIKGEFYECGVDCHRIESPGGKMMWYRVNSGKIAYFANKNKWDLISTIEEIPGATRGILNENGDLGYFIFDSFSNVYLSDNYYGKNRDIPISDQTICINADVAKRLGYQEDISTGRFYKKENLSTAALTAINTKRLNKYKNIRLNYGANEGSNTFLQINSLYNDKNNKIEIEERTAEVSKIFGNLSFGVEFETCNGTIPERLLGNLGLVPLRDGSLRKENGEEPYEYTTVPLYGAKGLQTLKNICEELTKRCEVDKTCSLHVHMGSFERTEEMILAMYILAYSLQEEIISAMPPYKSDPMKYLGSSKNYCARLESLGLDKNTIYSNETATKAEINAATLKEFNRIFSFLTDGVLAEPNRDYNMTSFNHPKGAKWHQHARYHLINFVPTVFSRSGTVEFRLHPPTVNFTKTINWLFICNAFVRFAEANKQAIIAGKLSKVTLADIISGYTTDFGNNIYEDKVGKQISDYLQIYIDERKKMFAADYKNKNYLGTGEFEQDPSYRFTDGNMNTIF